MKPSELSTKYLNKLIGFKCRKKRKGSPKPFKSGFQFNTIKGITINLHSNNKAFSFEEDDSVIDCDRVLVYDFKTNKPLNLADKARITYLSRHQKQKNETSIN